MLLFLFFFFISLLSHHTPLEMLWFSFPALTPAVWLNQSDRLWVPGESLSLSAVSFLLKFTLPVTNSFWHPFEKQRSLLDGPLWSLHTRTQAYTNTKCTKSAENMPHARHACTHTGTCRNKHDNLGRRKYTRCSAKGGHTLYPRYTYYTWHPTPLIAPYFHLKCLLKHLPYIKSERLCSWGLLFLSDTFY